MIIHSTTTSSPNISYYYPVPKSLLTLTLNSSSNPHFKNPNSITLNTTSNKKPIIKHQAKKNPNHQIPNHQIPDHFYTSIQQSQKPQDPDFGSDISSNMWWADLKSALGQRINIEGIASSVGILSKDNHLVIPHVKARDIRYIDWDEMKKRGFKGVVFDKDNTITVPYSLDLWDPLKGSIERCKSLFGDNIAVFSNSAGLCEYDPDGGKAKALEDAIGIKVIRHRVKKPAGSAEEIEKHFGCESSQLILVGDRPFTDIVYGNRNGFFTILTEPLSLKEEPLIVRQVRLFEVALVERWSRSGLRPTSHNLITDSVECVKDVPLL